MKNGDGYLSTSIHIRVLFGPVAGRCRVAWNALLPGHRDRKWTSLSIGMMPSR